MTPHPTTRGGRAVPDDPQPPVTPFALFPTAPPTPVRIVVADDNPVVRAGLTALLSGRADITVVAEAADGREAYEAARDHRPDVILLDVRMPGVDGIAALPHLVPIAPVLMLTYSGEPETVREALRRGADGYLVHGEFTADQLVLAVRDVVQGRTHLTPTAAGALLTQLRDANAHENSDLPAPVSPISSQVLSRLQPSVGQSSSDRSRFQLSAREAEIMDLIASGMTNQQIAAACFISEKTVKNHINRIFAKLHSTSRSEAAAKWLGTAPGSSRGVG
ncbi:response regulator transcription factor [Streptomyces sp. SID13726]|uniref:response regulator n=1 Tax=Streptomyces sp. SID13726 TaxID=2706058 RepID=UPI0013BAA3F2|nr:response regulator transcription factor [Streptomyces sp. SID13726]NEB04544.1 response regulator transcription factor [Streptomyces sp. SID13726]